MMAEFSTWLEATRFSHWLNGFAWLWPSLEILHFIGLALVVGGAGLLDLRLLGLFRGVSIQQIRAFMPFAIGGFLFNLFSGLAFLTMAPQMYLSSGIWWAKVTFLALAGLNAFFFESRLGAQALALDPNEDTPVAFKLVGGTSLFSWFAVLYCGRMLPYLGTGN